MGKPSLFFLLLCRSIHFTIIFDLIGCVMWCEWIEQQFCVVRRRLTWCRSNIFDTRECRAHRNQIDTNWLTHSQEIIKGNCNANSITDFTYFSDIDRVCVCALCTGSCVPAFIWRHLARIVYWFAAWTGWIWWCS